MAQEFKYLFSPIKVGPVTVKNRLYAQAHTTLYSEPVDKGIPDDRYVAYIGEKAKGGFGMIICGMFMVSIDSCAYGSHQGWDPRVIPQFEKLARACHEYDAKCVVQINHCGRENNIHIAHRYFGAPSPLPSNFLRVMPYEMTKDDIREIIGQFVTVARHAKEGGMDGVELHGGSGYLIQQFYSPFSNIRTDEYGGSRENRLRFLIELVDAVSTELGPNKILGMSYTQDEGIPGGINLDEAKEMVKVFLPKVRGKLHYINCRGYGAFSTYQTAVLGCSPMSYPSAIIEPFSAGIKEVANDIPVLAVGQLTDPIDMERIIAEGHADMVGMTRQAICDPELPNKAREGRIEEIRTCIHCLQGCIFRAFYGGGIPIGCIQNAAAGRERELSLYPASKKKKVMVIGGGPAGMESARVSASRGHEVMLYEKSDRLGGQINTIIRVPHREEFGNIIRWQTSQFNKLKVKVHLGVEAGIDTVKVENPDVVIVAVGGVPFVPSIPGMETGNVFDHRDVLEERVSLGDNVVVFSPESHQRLISTAIWLAERGKRVTLLDPTPMIGFDLDKIGLPDQIIRLKRAGVVRREGMAIKEILDRTVTILDLFTFTEEILEDVDAVVVCYPGVANMALYNELREKSLVKEIYVVGDCYAPASCESAIHSAYQTARLV